MIQVVLKGENAEKLVFKLRLCDELQNLNHFFISVLKVFSNSMPFDYQEALLMFMQLLRDCFLPFPIFILSTLRTKRVSKEMFL